MRVDCGCVRLCGVHGGVLCASFVFAIRKIVGSHQGGRVARTVKRFEALGCAQPPGYHVGFRNPTVLTRFDSGCQRKAGTCHDRIPVLQTK